MISVRLDSESESLLDRLSKKKGRSKSAIVKDALAMYFQKQSEAVSAYEAGKDLFGVSGGDTDLSVNYKAILKEKLGGKHSH